ncbi:hypothetical protein BH10ACT1_BH10ACT1_21920 [soil metagenome]
MAAMTATTSGGWGWFVRFVWFVRFNGFDGFDRVPEDQVGTRAKARTVKVPRPATLGGAAVKRKPVGGS